MCNLQLEAKDEGYGLSSVQEQSKIDMIIDIQNVYWPFLSKGRNRSTTCSNPYEFYSVRQLTPIPLQTGTQICINDNSTPDSHGSCSDIDILAPGTRHAWQTTGGHDQDAKHVRSGDKMLETARPSWPRSSPRVCQSAARQQFQDRRHSGEDGDHS